MSAHLTLICRARCPCDALLDRSCNILRLRLCGKHANDRGRKYLGAMASRRAKSHEAAERLLAEALR